MAQRRRAGEPFDDFEYLVIDGVSSDGTLDVVRAFEDRFAGRMHVVSEPDTGIYDAMNKAIDRAAGEYVIFVNADDWLEPDALAVAAAAVEAHDAANGVRPDCVGGAMRVHALDGDVRVQAPDRRQLRQRHPVRMPVGHQAMLMRAELLRTLGGFRLQFRVAADYDLFLRANAAGATWVFTDEILSDFALGGESYGIVSTAAEYRRVRIDNGQNALVAWLLFAKNVAASALVRLMPKRRS